MSASELIWVAPKDAVRRLLPLRYVCASYELEVDVEGRAVCPFHDDHNPSFELYRSDDDTHDRFKCFPCGAGGDIFNFIQLREGLTFPRALERARELLVAMDGRWRDAPSTPRRVELDAAALGELLAQAQATTELVELARLFQFPDVWGITLASWGWALTGDGFGLVPHWDANLQLAGLKTRDPDGTRAAIPGSSFPLLYPGWHPLVADRPALLCEGESDTVWAAFTLYEWQPRGLPSGSSSFKREWLAPLAGRDVWLAFDGDDAGRAATERWVSELAPVARRTVVVRVPDDHDLRSAAPTALELAKWATVYTGTTVG